MTNVRTKYFSICLLFFLIIFPGGLLSQKSTAKKTKSSKSTPKDILKTKSKSALVVTAPKVKKISFKEKLRSTYVTVVIHNHYVCGGFVVHSKGYVVTVAHVLSPKHSKIEVVSPVFGRKRVEIAAIDEGNDLALLKLPDRKEKYSALKIAKRRPKTYSRAFIFGSLNFRFEVLMSGKVASPDPVFFWLEDNEDYAPAFSIASDRPNFFGVPWVNTKCEVIGVQSAMFFYAGVSLVIPAARVRDLLKRRKTAATPTVGLELREMWQDTEASYSSIPRGLTGVIIVYVVEKGPASKAGLRKGEFIYEIDGQPIKNLNHFLKTLRSKKVKATLELGVLQPGRRSSKRKVFLRVGSLEKHWR